MKLFFTSLVFLLAGAATAAPTIVAKDAMNLPPGARVLESPDEVTQKNEISRIVNGTVSDPQAYPWFGRTAIAMFQNGVEVKSSSCGASLIHPQVAISAFHCIDDILTDPNLELDITIPFGANNIDGSDSLNTRKVETYHYYEEEYNFPLADLVVYVLDEPVADIDPIAFNEDSSLPMIGTMAKAIGFGLTSDGGSPSDVLMEVELEVKNATVCNDFFVDQVSESELVCVEAEGKGICTGDSGGPLVATVDGVLTTFGVTSFSGTCGVSPNGYIATSHYSSETDLIKEVICGLEGTKPEYCPEEPEDPEDPDEDPEDPDEDPDEEDSECDFVCTILTCLGCM